MKSIISKIFFYIILLTLTGILLYWRFQFGLHRYFDVDEFAHLKWAHDVYIGLHPYTDFFYFLPPLYLYTLLPLFLFIGKSTAVLLWARVIAFVLFVLTSIILYYLVVYIKDKKVALLTVFVFAFLPMPQDKWLEIRPDGIATFVSMVGMLFLVLVLQKNRLKYGFMAGLSYATSVFLLPKVAPFALVGGIIFLLYIHKRKRFGGWIAGFGGGVLIPFLVVTLLFVSYGNVSKAWYLVTKVSSHATAVLGKKFAREADLNFRPNGIYYGLEWYNLAWKANLAVWILGSIWAIKKLISFLDEKDQASQLTSLLVSSTYLVNLILYVKFIDLRHPQYLIPLSPLVAYFFAECVIRFTRRLPLVLLVAGILFYGAVEMYGVKLKWNNAGDLAYYNGLYHFLPSQEKVFDLTGEALFYPEGYYFCCVPYGQYEEALTFSYPNLERYLKSQKVKFIHVGYEGRLGVLPSIQQKVIRDYYVPHQSTVTSSFFVAGAKVLSNQDNEIHAFDLISEGNYLLVWQGIPIVSGGASNWVKIDGKPVSTNPLYLSAGKHTIQIAGIGEMVVRYSW